MKTTKVPLYLDSSEIGGGTNKCDLYDEMCQHLDLHDSVNQHFPNDCVMLQNHSWVRGKRLVDLMYQYRKLIDKVSDSTLHLRNYHLRSITIVLNS